MKEKTNYCLMICVFLLLYSSCKTKTKGDHNMDASQDCIDQILKSDSEYGKIRNHYCETFSLTKTIKLYVDNLSQLDFNDCPDEFTQAFRTHINAWEGMVEITDKYPSLRGEMHTLFDQIESGPDSLLFKPALNLIWSTWEAVEKATN